MECDQCAAVVDADVVGNYVVTSELAPSAMYSLLKCPRCSAPFLVQQGEDIFGDGWNAPDRLFPPEVQALGNSVPRSIQAAFEEARKCLRARAFTAAAMMCRKTLEGVCAAHDAKNMTLAAALNKLQDQGTIDKRLFEWADALRIFGNEAAHDVEVTIEGLDASDMMDFTRALVEYVFTFQDRFQSFKKRREKPEPSTTPW